MCLFLKELGGVEDIILKNFIRENEVNKYKNPRAHEAWKEFIKDLKKRMDEEFAMEEEEEKRHELEDNTVKYIKK